MTHTTTYTAPSIEDLGSLHDLTLAPVLVKDFTGVDGVVLQPTNTPLGPVSG